MELVDLIVEIDVGQGWMKRGREGRKKGRRKTVGREGGRADRWSVRVQREGEKDRRMLKEGREQKA
jgi:hypothetical protein